MLTEGTPTNLNVVFQKDDWTLVHGDALAVMSGIPDSSVDLIFADPPYHLSNGGFSVHSGKQVSVDKGSWDVSRGPDADFEFHLSWLAECRRILKDSGTIWVSGTYHSIFQCGYALQTLGFRILNDVSWFKPNASPNLGRRMFTASHETLIWASKSVKSKHVFNYAAMREGHFPADTFKRPGKQMRSVWGVPDDADVWVIPTTPKSEKEFPGHPTQKPLALMERVIAASSLEGDMVLDPFVGSGTTGIAAANLGRRFLGIDNNLEFLTSVAIPRYKANAIVKKLQDE
jgi:site-specific DNA-methyltransferase (adenine-specific)